MKTIADEMEQFGELEGFILSFVKELRGDYTEEYIGKMLAIIIRALNN